MSRPRRSPCAPVASLLIALLVVQPAPWVEAIAPSVEALAAGSPALSRTLQAGAPQKAAPAAAPAEAEPDLGWPRDYPLADGAHISMYQPQIESWANQRHMVAWAALSYEAAGAKAPVLGTVRLEADTSVAIEDRLVSFTGFTISQFHFPELSREQARTVVTGLQKAMPPAEQVIGLDRVMTAMDKSSIKPQHTDGVKADPPHIFLSQRPAVLVSFDGTPVWSPIQGVDLKFAVNTNWDVFEDSAKTVYLRDDRSWLQAPQLSGSWTAVRTLPPSFDKLPADENWKDVKAHVPARPFPSPGSPTVFVSNEPAELLLLNGAPALEPVDGTALFWVNNTESDLFRLGKSGAYYYLVAGRWFSAANLSGPWTFATPTLPDDFKKIPVDHPRSRVLASVPGTDQAIEAVLLAELPRTARVNIKEIAPPEVEYQGEPNFEPIDKTSLSRAVNTDKDIIKAGDLYYMCFQAVWFMSRTPTGPWEVARTVPSEIYSIPPSSPAHHVTYVTVQADDNPNDEWLTFAYVAGYTGMMIAWGCAVWGTGWYYPPYVWYGGMYPGYFWYPRTYGFSAWYNPWTGSFGRGTAVYGPYGGAGAAAVYNPRTGTYARGAAAYGPYGAGGVAEAWNPRTGTYARTRQGSNIYGHWGSSYVQRGDEWARTTHATNRATGATTRTIRGNEGGAVTRRGAAGRTTIGRGEGGDIFAGHNGDVYRRDSSGGWSQWSSGDWTPADTTENRGQLERDNNARVRGQQRTEHLGAYRQAPSRERAGSFGGGRRFGGRRR